MTSQHGSGRRYTVEEFAALPENRSVRCELQGGLLVVSPRPFQPHMIALGELGDQLRSQVPSWLRVIQEIEVVLDGVPVTVRAPDLVVMPRSALRQRGMARSAEILLAVEIVSAGSVKTDNVVKFMEYADAGIPHFWVVDPKPPVTATVYRLVDGHYEESQRAEGAMRVTEPCPLTVDLNALTDEMFS